MQTHLRSLLEEGHPLYLLIEASGIIEMLTERPTDRFSSEPPADLTLEGLVTQFLTIDVPEATALLQALRTLLPPSPIVGSIDAELAKRTWRLPGWVEQLDQIEIVSTVESRDPLGDGDNIYVTVRWPTGSTMTAWPYIDHNMGTVVKDALATPVGIEEIGNVLDQHGDADLTLDFIDAADARTRFEEAVAKGERFVPPLESESWPRLRPLLEWVMGQLPTGGRGYLRPEWTVEDREELSRAFLESPFGREFQGDADSVDAVWMLIGFGCDSGTGDPLRWSPVVVEMVLADWFPRSVVTHRELRERVPDVLRAFIRYCHGEQAIPSHLTDETLEAVDRWKGSVIDAAPPRLDLRGDVYSGPPEIPPGMMLAILSEEVGGMGPLEALDDIPHPEEEFDWAGIPEDIHERVGEVLELTDRCCEERLDIEYRTILRRTLARTALGDPGIFRRKGRSDIAAAAMVWMVGRANDFTTVQFTTKELTAWFGIKGSPSSQRGVTFRKALGIPNPHDSLYLDSSLLHSDKRRSLVEDRDRYRRAMAQE
jgi:hypothetical protein